MGKIKYIELNLENDKEKEYRVFAVREIIAEHHHPDWDYVSVSDHELMTGKKIAGEYGECQEGNLHPTEVAEFSNFEWFCYQYSCGRYNQNDFEELKRDTAEGIPNFYKFLRYKETKEVDITAIDEYLQKLEDDGELDEYVEYIKGIALRSQREYVDKLSLYFNRILDTDEATKRQESEAAKAEQRVLARIRKTK